MRCFRVAYDAIDEANVAVGEYVIEMAVSSKPPGRQLENKILRLRDLMSDAKELAHEINEEIAWD